MSEDLNKRGKYLMVFPPGFRVVAAIVLTLEIGFGIGATVKLHDWTLVIVYLALIIALVFLGWSAVNLLAQNPRAVYGQFDDLLDNLLNGLGGADRDVLCKIHTDGNLQYKHEDRNEFKHLRNRGLVQTGGGGPMREERILVLTPLGALIAQAIQREDRDAT